MVAFFKANSVPYRPILAAPRLLSPKFLALLGIFTLLGLVTYLLPSDYRHSFLPSRRPSTEQRGTCPPRSWAAGQWVSKPPPTTRTNLTKPQDAYEFLGLEGCASSREHWWHLAADKPELYDRFPGVASWRWSPPSNCRMRELDPTAVVKDLVERGGWLLVGDSVTENHFFSLSCLLYPHVRATPDYNKKDYARDHPQNLYLDKSSPLISSINFPPGFDIEKTPLLTFRRIDLLMSQPQLDTLYHTLHPNSKYIRANESLFSDEATWTLDPAEYVKIFTSPLPEGNYATMVVSTGGHWTTTLFSGLKDAGMYNDGIQNVLDFFSEAMDTWARQVQAMLEDVEQAEWEKRRTQLGWPGARSRALERRVVVRAYLPGHEDCHTYRAPRSSYEKGRWGWYNWNEIGQYNDAFEGRSFGTFAFLFRHLTYAVLKSGKYPGIHFLPIDRPALLRPDAHATGDCLHIMSGAGVLEGWTHYIWHYVTRELPERTRRRAGDLCADPKGVARGTRFLCPDV